MFRMTRRGMSEADVKSLRDKLRHLGCEITFRDTQRRKAIFDKDFRQETM